MFEEVARRPRHALMAALACGLALAGVGDRPGVARGWLIQAAPAMAVIALALWLLTRALAGTPRQPAPSPLLAALPVLLLGGVLAGDARLAALDRALAGPPPGSLIATRATVLERPRPGRFGASLLVATPAGTRYVARLGPGASGAAMRVGAEVRLEGYVRHPSASGEDVDWLAHLRRRGVSGELALSTLALTGARRGGWRGAIDAARSRSERGLARGAAPEHAALAAGMVLGQDERIDELVRDDFRASGLAHLLAVSGQNIMLLCALALPLLAALRLGPRGRVAVLLALIAAYVPLAGAGASLQRAGVMGAAGLVAVAAGRPSSRAYAVGLAAAATLALSPRNVGDPGWQLSFAAVAGILLARPRGAAEPSTGGSARPGPLGRLARDGARITMAATLATAPLLAHHFDTLSLAALPVNLLALPAVAPAMWCGMVQITLAQLEPLGALGAIAGPLLDATGELGGLPLAYLGWLARSAAVLPGAQVGVSLGSAWAVAGAYFALASSVVAATRVGGALRQPAAPAGAAWRRQPMRRRIAFAALLAALGAVAVRGTLGAGAAPERLTVSFLDVGQGDATLVQHPDGSALLFDGGPPEARVARLLRGAGVTRLSAVVATHASRDHHGGLEEVLERLPVDLLVDGGDGTRDPAFRRVLAAADRRGVRRVPARAGQVLRAGSLTVRVLGPSARPPGPAPEDPNPRAVVAVVSSGAFDLFLSADAESGALAPLVLPDVEAMKVSHHGSADPGLPAVLAQLRPQVAAIEVGADNSYGHPAPPTLAALHAVVPQVMRTDRDGTVRLLVGDEGMEVRTDR